MSIQSQITRITGARDASFQKVASKGVTVPSDANIDDLPDLIDAIETGGGTGGITQDSEGYLVLDSAASSGSGTNITKGTIKVTNNRASGSFTLYRITYDLYTPNGLGTYSNSISNGNTSTSYNVALFNGTTAILHVAYALNNITYNGSTADFEKHGSSAQWDIYLTMPDNYDDTIPFVFS